MSIPVKYVFNTKAKKPIGDVMVGLAIIEEENQSYEFHKQIGLETGPIIRTLIPAIYILSTDKWMSAGFDINDKLIYWTIPFIPQKLKLNKDE